MRTLHSSEYRTKLPLYREQGEVTHALINYSVIPTVGVSNIWNYGTKVIDLKSMDYL